MASSMVIKVNYVDTLRRFNATVNEDGQLDLDMAGLRAKVSSLFSFKPNADILLTYVDEDGDVVTLIDDDDLRDAMRQQLRFLRIDVYLNNPPQVGRSYVRSSGGSTPLRSPRDQHTPVPSVNRAVSDVLQYMPEALQGPLLKLSHDLTSKATSSTPALAEIIDVLTKIQLFGAAPDSQLNLVRETSAGAKASGSSDEGAQPQVSQKSTETPEPSSKTNPEVPKSKDVGAGKSTLRRPSVDLNKLPAECESSEPQLAKPGKVACPVSYRKEKKKLSNDVQKQKWVGFGEPSGCVPIHLKHFNPGPPGPPPPPPPPPPAPPLQAHGYNPFSECPFYGLPITSDSVEPRVPFRPFSSIKRHHAEVMGGIFHRGVRCDICGVHPITGPRYKSKVKEDYDLCSVCFVETGNETDYMKIDRPMSFRHHPHAFKGLPDQSPWIAPPTIPRVVLGCGGKSSRVKLDSRFVLDVNVDDGTVMPPLAPFTKIWRMQNNGGILWPQGTQLVWIGGDRFSQAFSVELEIPANGVSSDGELDIAVDFVAPQYPGRYVSYWRMASPSGQKFGQRVWVLIQVDASLKSPFPPAPDAPLDLDLDVPSFSTGGNKVVTVKASDCDSPKPATESLPKSEHDQNFPINDNLLVGHGVSAPPPATVPMPTVSYPIIDLTEEPEDDVFFESSPAVAVAAASSSSAPPVVHDTALLHEENLLKELGEMGFRQVELNKQVLRMNKYDLEKSVDYLCGVTEWDPMLDELEEMGFHDTEKNKKLLAKNNGSIKRVVMDLIQGEKEKATKTTSHFA